LSFRDSINNQRQLIWWWRFRIRNRVD